MDTQKAENSQIEKPMINVEAPQLDSVVPEPTSSVPEPASSVPAAVPQEKTRPYTNIPQPINPPEDKKDESIENPEDKKDEPVKTPEDKKDEPVKTPEDKKDEPVKPKTSDKIVSNPEKKDTKIPLPFILKDTKKDLGKKPLSEEVISDFQHYNIESDSFEDVNDEIKEYIYGENYKTEIANLSQDQENTYKTDKWVDFQNNKLVPAINNILSKIPRLTGSTGPFLESLSPPGKTFTHVHPGSKISHL
jgi:hypothetical protein